MPLQYVVPVSDLADVVTLSSHVPRTVAVPSPLDDRVPAGAFRAGRQRNDTKLYQISCGFAGLLGPCGRVGPPTLAPMNRLLMPLCGTVLCMAGCSEPPVAPVAPPSSGPSSRQRLLLTLDQALLVGAEAVTAFESRASRSAGLPVRYVAGVSPTVHVVEVGCGPSGDATPPVQTPQGGSTPPVPVDEGGATPPVRVNEGGASLPSCNRVLARLQADRPYFTDVRLDRRRRPLGLDGIGTLQ